MPIIDATAIGLLYVMFVIPLGVLMLKETVGRRHVVGIVLCCLGAAVVVGSRGAFTAFEPAYLWPAGIAVVGAALLAIEGLMIRVFRPATALVHLRAVPMTVVHLASRFSTAAAESAKSAKPSLNAQSAVALATRGIIS